MDLFDEVKDCKSYWNLVKNAAHSQASQPILGIQRPDRTIETSDLGKAQIFNEYFSTVGEKLSSDLQICSQEDRLTHFTRVTPCVMNIGLSYNGIAEGLKKLKSITKPADQIM